MGTRSKRKKSSSGTPLLRAEPKPREKQVVAELERTERQFSGPLPPPEVLEHYNRAPDAMIGHNEAKPLKLNQLELLQLEKFLLTLGASIDAPVEWISAPK